MALDNNPPVSPSKNAVVNELQLQGNGLLSFFPGVAYQLLYRVDGSLQFVMVGAGAEDVLGVSAQALQEGIDRLLVLMSETDRSQFLTSLAAAAQANSDWHWSGLLQGRSGRMKWVETTARSQQTTDGDTLWTGFWLDSTERRGQEAELARSSASTPTTNCDPAFSACETHLNAILSDLPIMLHVLDREGQFVRSEGKGLQQLGLRAGQLVGASIYTTHHSAPGFLTLVNRALQGHPCAAVAKLGTHWYNHWLSPVKDADGEVTGAIVIAMDISVQKQAEEDRDRFFTHSLDMLCIAGTDGYFKRINPAWSKALGYTADELLTMPFASLVHADDRPKTRLEMEKIAKGAEVVRFENRCRCKDGSYRWFSWFSAVSKDDDLIYSVARDITSIKQTEAELLLYKQAVESSSVAIGIADAQGQHIYQNKAFSQLFECDTVEEFCATGGGAACFVNSADMRRTLGKVLQGNSWEGEIELQSRQGRTFQAYLRADAIRDGSGAIVGSQANVVDITGRKQAEKGQAKLLTILEATTDMVCTATVDGDLLYINKAGREMMSIGQDEERPIPVSSFYPKSALATLQKEILPQVLEQGLWSGESVLLTQDGLEIPVSQVIMAHRSEAGAVEYLSMIVRDIRSQKQAEANLLEREQFLRTIYDGLESAVFVVDVEDENMFYYTDWNAPAARLIGVKNLEICRLSPQDLFGEVKGAAICESYRRCVQEAASLSYEECISLHGQDSWLLTTLNPLLNTQGQVYCIVVTSFDISDRKRAEAQLQEREQFLRTIYDGIDQQIAVIDVCADGEFRYAGWNRLAGTTYGLPSARVAGKSLEVAMGPQEGQRWRQRLEVAIKSGMAATYEDCLDSYGEETWWLSRVNVLRNDQGDIYRLVTTTTEITDRKKVEKAWSRLVSILEATPDLVITADADNYCTYINRAGRQLLGLTETEDISTLQLNTFHSVPTYARMQREVMPAVVRHGVWAGENTILTLAGKEVPVSQVMLGHRSPDGNFEYLSTIARDISREKQAQVELLSFQRRVSLLIQQTPLAVIEWDTEMRVTAWNPAAERIFGYTAEEMIGCYGIEPLVPSETYPDIQQLVNDMLARREAFRSVNENLTKTGDVILCEWYNTPLIDPEGCMIGLASLAMDITERRRVEVQLQQQAQELEQALHELQCTQSQLVQTEKMSSLGQLVAGIAHEINNPVNFIYGNLSHANGYTQDLLQLVQLYQQHYPTPHPEILEEMDAIDLEFLMEDLPKLLNSMKVGADRIQQIVTSLRNFSRMDEAEMKEVNIHEGIDSTLLILQNRLKSRPDHPGIEVQKEYATLPLVECYAGQLNQVFMNILSNAIDALEERDRQRTFEQIEQEPSLIRIVTTVVGRDQVAIHLIDNGPGISDAVQQRLFDPFFTTKPVGKGTGLGMSISYQIVTEKHQGELTCQSVLGQGATFTIAIPIRQS